MNEILKIEGSRVLIGMENGEITEVALTDLDFTPKEGDKVRVYTYENEIYVRKDEAETQKIKYDFNIDKSGIHDLDEYYYEEIDGKVLVNKWIYVVLAFITGSFGVHKFYSKKIGKGILYFLFFWTGIPAIIGLIEGIIAVTKTPDLDGNILM